MAATIIIGAQWGDEGKGKIIDYLSSKSTVVARFHGGNNAGHTVINNYGKFAMHLVPSGIFNKKSIGVIGNGTIVDLEVLISEIKMLEDAGVKLRNRLFISPRCHLIMPYHKLLEQAYEKEKKGKHTPQPTGRGIGPTYADKVSYNGIRIFDLQDKKIFREKLAQQVRIKNKILSGFGISPLSKTHIEKQYLNLFVKIKPFIKEPFRIVNEALQKNEEILLEGAHGVFLDNNWGNYPYVTASNVMSAEGSIGLGIPPQQINKIIGVSKAYATRVGFGPFPTELLGKDAESLRKLGNEFGSTTGRPRRCGWIDVEMLRFAAKINGFTDLAITKMDILDSFDLIKICIQYMLNGKAVNYQDISSEMLFKVKPVYITLPGWKSNTNGKKNYKELPVNAKKYLKELEKQIGVKISYISTGAETENIIIV